MDPISSFVMGHVAGKVVDYTTRHFQVQIIERWSKYRAKQFFDEFCTEVELELGGTHSEKLNDSLSKLLADDAGSEALFDAYRRVTLAKSKIIGPRLIGIITAELVLQRRMANEFEDILLTAAENLTDEEMIGYSSFCREQLTLADDPKNEDVTFDEKGGLRIKWCDEQFDSNWKSKEPVSISPIDLGECLGRWASRLKEYGVISADIRECSWEYEEDSERHIDSNGTIREISWWIYIPKPFFRLAEIVERVSQRK